MAERIIKVSVGRTINRGNFESEKFEIGIERSVKDDDIIATEEINRLWDELKEYAEQCEDEIRRK